MILQFGKYRGCSIRQVPDEYLDWLLKTQKETVQAIETEIERRRLADDEDSTNGAADYQDWI